MTLVRRAEKGSPLTIAEMDGNWDHLVGLHNALQAQVGEIDAPSIAEVPGLTEALAGKADAAATTAALAGKADTAALEDKLSTSDLPSALSDAGALTLVDEAPEGSEDWPLEAVYRYGGVLYAQSFPVVPFAQASATQAMDGSAEDVYVGPQTWTGLHAVTDLGSISGATAPDLAAGALNIIGSMTGDVVIGIPTNMAPGIERRFDLTASGGSRNLKFGTGLTYPGAFDNDAGATVAADDFVSFRLLRRGGFHIVSGFELYGEAEPEPENSITRIAHGSGNGDTIAISGVEAGDLIVGVVMRTGSAARPVFDSGGGRTRIDDDTWFAGGDRSTIAFWKIAESTTPSFGAHTDGVRVMWQAYRYALGAPVNPIGDVAYLSGNAGGYLTSAYWTGLTLEGPAGKSHVFTYMGRTANEALGTRPGGATAFGEAGATVRYRGYYDGPVSSWPEEIVAQSVSGPSQCVAIEVRV